MTRVASQLMLLCLVLAPFAARAEVATQQTIDLVIDKAIDQLVELKLAEAERTLAAIEPAQLNRADVLFARAQLAFYRGEYAEAVQLSIEANAGATQRERRAWEEVSKLMLASRDVTADYARRPPRTAATSCCIRRARTR
jgi:hypothetical protein